MKQSTLRSIIALVWGGGFVISVLALLAQPRLNPMIPDEHAVEAIKSVTAAWLPIVGCVIAFWFGDDEARKEGAMRWIPGGRATGAVAVAAGYAALVVIVIFWVGHGINGPEYHVSPDEHLSWRLRFDIKLASAMQLPMMVGPVGVWVPLWLSGRAPAGGASLPFVKGAPPLLAHGEIVSLLPAAVACDLASKRAALLAGIDRALVSSLPAAPDDLARLLSDLSTLNTIPRLSDGSVPLATWLANAVALGGPRVEADVFRTSLARLAPKSPAAPPSTIAT